MQLLTRREVVTLLVIGTLVSGVLALAGAPVWSFWVGNSIAGFVWLVFASGGDPFGPISDAGSTAAGRRAGASH